MRESCVQYQVDAGDRIRVVDDEWIEFARQNAAAELGADSVLGRSLWQFIAGSETRQLYEILFAAVRDEGSVRKVPFRCDSPTRRRYMELVVSPLTKGSLAIRGTLVREEIRPYVPLLDYGVPRTHEFVAICSWCKHVRLRERRWVEVEVAISHLGLFEGRGLPQLSHGICEQCEEKFEG